MKKKCACAVFCGLFLGFQSSLFASIDEHFHSDNAPGFEDVSDIYPDEHITNLVSSFGHAVYKSLEDIVHLAGRGTTSFDIFEDHLNFWAWKNLSAEGQNSLKKELNRTEPGQHFAGVRNQIIKFVLHDILFNDEIYPSSMSEKKYNKDRVFLTKKYFGDIFLSDTKYQEDKDVYEELAKGGTKDEDDTIFFGYD